jgi:PTS system nitrogen regulatory IIA component
MMTGFDLCDLIHAGGLYYNVEGTTPKEIYTNICKSLSLPQGYDRDIICQELLAREDILSTAVGNGISIPHPRRPVIKNSSDQRLAICFLKNPIDLHAPDSRKVFVMFVLLSSSTQFHLQVLSQLATLFRDADFRRLLESKPSENDLLLAVKKAVV